MNTDSEGLFRGYTPIKSKMQYILPKPLFIRLYILFVAKVCKLMPFKVSLFKILTL